MPRRLILASQSEIRAQMLRNAGVSFDALPARVDEDAMKNAMLAEHAPPRDIADALAEMKAQKLSSKYPEALVLGCDQVLEVEGRLLSKPENPQQAAQDLTLLRGKTHRLLSAVVICEGAKPIWRHIGIVRLKMRDFSDSYRDAYIDRNWDSIQHSVGAYKLEEEGVRLFSMVQGDYFNVMGLPLIELLSYLTLRGELET